MSSRWASKEVKTLKEKYPTTPAKKLAEEFNRTKQAVRDKASREQISKHPQHKMIERIKTTETPEFVNDEMNHFISGFTAGEGSFTRSGEIPTFQISLAIDDKKILEDIKNYLGVGNVTTSDARKESWKDEAHYTVRDRGELWKVIVPFFDSVGLRETHKEKQYRDWRETLKSNLPAEVV